MQFRRCILLPLLSLLWLPTSPSLTESTVQPIEIVTSIPALADILTSVGGMHVHVVTLSSGDAHVRDLKPSQIQRSERADLIVLASRRVESWGAALSRATGREVLYVEDTTSEVDPHLWLNPSVVKQFARVVVERLCKKRHQECEYFRGRGRSYEEKVLALDTRIHDLLREWKGTVFVAVHPSWGAFARRYGLRQIGVLDDSESYSLGPRDLARIFDVMRAENVSVLIVEPGMDRGRIAHLFGEHVKIVTLDPIGIGGESYVDLMDRNVKALVGGFRASGTSQ